MRSRTKERPVVPADSAPSETVVRRFFKEEATAMGVDPGIDRELYLRLVAWVSIRANPDWRRSCAAAATRFGKAARFAFEMSLKSRLRVGADDLPWNLHVALQEALESKGTFIARKKLAFEIADLLPPEGETNQAARKFMNDYRALAPATDPGRSWTLREVMDSKGECLDRGLRWKGKRMAIGKALNTFLPPETWSDNPEGFMQLATNLARMANWLAEAASGPTGQTGSRAAERPKLSERFEMVKYAKSHGIGTGQLAHLVVRMGFAGVPPSEADEVLAWKRNRVTELTKEFNETLRTRAPRRASKARG